MKLFAIFTANVAFARDDLMNWYLDCDFILKINYRLQLGQHQRDQEMSAHFTSKQYLITYTKRLHNQASHEISSIPVAEQFKEWVCGRSLSGTAVPDPAADMPVCCECCVLSGRGLCDELIAPTGCGMTECDRKASIMRRPWPTSGCCATETKKKHLFLV